jgi:hypothetical protein
VVVENPTVDDEVAVVAAIVPARDATVDPAGGDEAGRFLRIVAAVVAAVAVVAAAVAVVAAAVAAVARQVAIETAVHFKQYCC